MLTFRDWRTVDRCVRGWLVGYKLHRVLLSQHRITLTTLILPLHHPALDVPRGGLPVRAQPKGSVAQAGGRAQPKGSVAQAHTQAGGRAHQTTVLVAAPLAGTHPVPPCSA